MKIEEVYQKYGEEELKFSSYYKYSFTFNGVAKDGVEVVVSYGNNADDIYRYEVTAKTTKTLSVLCPSWIKLTKDGEIIFEWYE